MRRDTRVSAAAHPAQPGVASDPRRWPARSLACAQALAKIELQTLAKSDNGPPTAVRSDAIERSSP